MKLPRYVWILVMALCLAELFFWVGMLQTDMMFWSGWGYQEACDWIWVPELGISVKDFYELMFCLAVLGFHIPIIIIVWLLGEQLSLSTQRRNAVVGYTLFILGLGVALHDFCHTLWQVGGYWEILSLQGGYIGFILMVIGVVIILWRTRVFTAQH